MNAAESAALNVADLVVVIVRGAGDPVAGIVRGEDLVIVILMLVVILALAC